MLGLPTRLLPAILVFVGGVAASSGATSVVPVTFDELVDNAREIFLAQVVGIQANWLDSRDGRAIVTLVTFRVDESFKGGLQTQTSIEFLGGTIGDVRFEVVGMPEFRIGDREVLFVGDRTAVSPLVGFMQGRFRVVKNPWTGVESVRTYDGRAIASTADVGRSKQSSTKVIRSMTLAEFRASIVARVRLMPSAR